MSKPPGQHGRRRPWMAALGWFAVWLTVAGLVVLPYMQEYRMLSPFDELVHVDYLDKAQRLEHVNGGEKVGEAAMRAQACRGHEIAALQLPPCDHPDLVPEHFPELGFNTAYPDPPTYYYVTAWVALALDLLPGVDDLVTTGRAVGVLWLGAGLALTFLLALRLGASRLAAAGATLVVASSAAVAHASATITSDAPALLVGALLCLVALSVVRGHTAWWWLVPAAAATTATKPSAFTVVGAVLVFLLLDLLSRRVAPDPTESPGPGRKAPARRTLLSLGAVVAGAVAPFVAWTLVTTATETSAADDIPMRATFHAESLTWPHIADNLFALVTPVTAGYLPLSMQSHLIVVLMGAVNLLLISALVGLSWFGRFTSSATRLAVATLVSMVLSGPVLVVLIFLGSHDYVPIPPRYGLTLVPPAAACLAVVASRRRAGALGLVALGSAGMAALLVQTL